MAERAHTPDWVRHAVFWHVYPLGFLGAERTREELGVEVRHRLPGLLPWLDHAARLGASALLLGPVFESRTHGYDTTDHLRVDARLGDTSDLLAVVEAARARGLRVVLDGVFNHVGQDFEMYRRALAEGPASPAARWFRLHWPDPDAPDGGGAPTHDDFEGHAALVALNHDEPQVADYVVHVMTYWLDRGVDGWRLDAAYAVPPAFWRPVLERVRERHPEAYVVGEVIHGDYTGIVAESGMDAVTQYELWKAVWSSLNDRNFWELEHALGRHATFCRDFAPLTFVGNHDVTRIASRLADRRHVEHAVVLLLTVGGVPSIYAGDEAGYLGVKEERFGGDDAIRPEFGSPPIVSGAGENTVAADLVRLHQHLIGLRRRNPWLHTATTAPLHLTNTQYVYESRSGEHALVVALNIDTAPLPLRLSEIGLGAGRVVAGSGAPPAADLTNVDVAPHGWLIIEPAR